MAIIPIKKIIEVEKDPRFGDTKAMLLFETPQDALRAIEGGVSIKEINVPKGFTATYSKNGYTFIVTNTPALAQTGQMIWPIPVFALAGMFFMLLGFMILRKPGKYNA